MEHRKDKPATDGEPLLTDTRRLQEDRGSLLVNLMSEFRDINDLEQGDTVTVQAYRDRYVVVVDE